VVDLFGFLDGLKTSGYLFISNFYQQFTLMNFLAVACPSTSDEK
jgi:hypothetical protein